MAQFTTTYSGLLAKIQSYVEDTTTEFSNEAQGIINRSEERLLRDLDLSIFNTTTTTSTSGGTSTVSKGFTDAPVQSIFCTSANGGLEPRSRAYINDMGLGAQGVPLYYDEDQSTLYLAPVPDAAYTLSISYVLRPTPLSASSETNWITQHAADALLWAALVESEEFLIAPERKSEFENNYAKALGPLRAFWRSTPQISYEPVAPTPQPVQTR